VSRFNPFDHPIIFRHPLRLATSAWAQHLPFAMFLVDLLRPGTLVELGTHYGVSYCAFCQGVKELALDSRCYAVDTWEGDSQAGFFGPDVLQDLRAHHDPLYGSFSRLVQSTFDEALGHFADGSIDLLHIDGFHTYDAVRHDFETWLPKMSDRGVILFHDTNVRERDFGVWKLWDELKERYPHTEFLHGHGLGMLAVGTRLPEALKEFIGAFNEQPDVVRGFFHERGEITEAATEVVTLRRSLAEHAAVVQEQQALIGSLSRQLQTLKEREEELRRMKLLYPFVRLRRKALNGSVNTNTLVRTDDAAPSIAS
jgi:hypothetical protein